MKEEHTNRDYFLAFNHFIGIGPIRFKKIESYFSSLSEAFWANSDELEKAGLETKIIKEFIKWRVSFSLERAIKTLKEEKISFVTWHDYNYPKLLLEISSPPPILYYKGILRADEENEPLSLAVVGARNHSPYAEKSINELIGPLIYHRIEIISGLAYGIDSLAHRAALNAKGRTMAVLGSGLSQINIYPLENKKLADDIIKNGGAIISEFPPDTPPIKSNFPRRNRIISGLSQATLIIEAKQKSGSLITASYALEQNRDVLAVPGSIFSLLSGGTNKLIQDGAKLITCFGDILEVFNINVKKTSPKINRQISFDFKTENNNEKIILDILLEANKAGESLTTDELIKKTKLDTAIINSTLSILEVREVIKNDDGKYSLNI